MGVLPGDGSISSGQGAAEKLPAIAVIFPETEL
jgi:hypothetical protein